MLTTNLNGDLTVNETIRLYPNTIAVFNEFGIDSCCGGAVPVSVAAERDGVDLASLLERLTGVIAAGSPAGS